MRKNWDIVHDASKVLNLDLTQLLGNLASRLKSPVRVRVNLDWNEEATSVKAVRRFTKLLGGAGIEA